MSSTDLKGWAQLLTGPFSALILCAGLLYTVLSYLPTVVDRHFETVDKMIDSHDQDRELYRESLERLTRELSQIKE